MATWVNYSAACRFPKVMKAYGERDFRRLVLAEITGAGAWARVAPGVEPVQSDGVWQVDVSAVPGVPALTRSGVLA